MIPLHAPDPMGEAAHKAAMLASGLDIDLLAARSPDLDRSTRAWSLERAFRKYFALCRAMSELEQIAHVTAERARQADSRIQDFTEHHNPAEQIGARG